MLRVAGKDAKVGRMKWDGGRLYDVSVIIIVENYICFSFNGFPASRVPEMESDRRQLTRNVLLHQKSFF